MYYACRRCGKKRELRKSKTPGNPREKYLAVERAVNESKVLEVKNKGRRALCPSCLRALAEWVKPTA